MSYGFKIKKGLDFRVGNSPKTPLRARILCLLESKRKGKEAGAKGLFTRSKPPFSLTLLQQRLQNGSLDTPNNVRFCSVFSRMQHNLGEKLSYFSLQKYNNFRIKSHKTREKEQIFHYTFFAFHFIFVPLTSSNVLSFDNTKQKKQLLFCIVLTYSYLCSMKETKWNETVILVDADYVDKVAFNLIVNFERMIGRRIPQADMAQWLECVALDGGLREGNHQTQVVLLHKQAKMENFKPDGFAELDGKAFEGRLGEFLISCVKVEELTTMDDLFIDSMQVLSNAAEVKRLIVVPDAEHIYNKVREGLRHADDEKRVTVLAMQPMEGGNFRQEILGYSLMAALGIKSEELNKMS